MNKYNLLKDFCQKENIKAVDSILGDSPDLIDGEKSSNGFPLLTPLSIALLNHKLKMAKHLLDKGTDINQKLILEKVKTNLLNTLVELEAEVFYEQENKYPQKIYIKNLEFAIENNIYINEYDEKGYTALDIALKSDHYSGANYLYSVRFKHSRKMFNEFDFKNKKGNELKYYQTAYPYLKGLKSSDCVKTVDYYVYPKELPSCHRELDRILLEKKCI